MGFLDINSVDLPVDTSIPDAIPSFNREQQLVEQTLATLTFYRWNLKLVFVFLDVVHKRDCGTTELVAYRKHLTACGYGQVTFLRGGCCLMAQYQAIFAYFKRQKVVVLSDTVPGIVWRRHQSHLTTTALPCHLLHRLVCIMFCFIAEKHWHIWSLGPCKGPRNLQPGHNSQKCGLLDSKFFGVDLISHSASTLCVSKYTTDVELSLRMWERDGGFARMLGVSALHEYRQVGGHGVSGKIVHQRSIDTDNAIQKLVNLYPGLLKFIPDTHVSAAAAVQPVRVVRYIIGITNQHYIADKLWMCIPICHRCFGVWY